MIGPPDPAPRPCVVDNVVLAMFVDAGRAAPLAELAAGHLAAPQSIVDTGETPPFARQPTAEFARGAFYLRERLGQPLAAVRFQRRMAFYLDAGAAWRPASLSTDDLRQVDDLLEPETWRRAVAIDPTLRSRRIDRGEAECATVAITHGWTLWTDDDAVVALVGALHSGVPIERISDLLIRAVREGLLACEAAADLYNGVFKGVLGLWTKLALDCENGELVVRRVSP